MDWVDQPADEAVIEATSWSPGTSHGLEQIQAETALVGRWAVLTQAELARDAVSGFAAVDLAHSSATSLLDPSAQASELALSTQLEGAVTPWLTVDAGVVLEILEAPLASVEIVEAPAPTAGARLMPLDGLEISAEVGTGLDAPVLRRVVSDVRAQAGTAFGYNVGATQALGEQLSIDLRTFRTGIDDSWDPSGPDVAVSASPGTGVWSGASGALHWGAVHGVDMSAEVTTARSDFEAQVPASRTLGRLGVATEPLVFGRTGLTLQTDLWSLGQVRTPGEPQPKIAVAADLTATAEVGRTAVTVEVGNALAPQGRVARGGSVTRWSVGEPTSVQLSTTHRFR